MFRHNQKDTKMKTEIKGALRLPDPNPMDVILHGLRPNDDWYEKKQLDEKDEVWKGKLTLIERRNKDGANSKR